ncbi:TIGR01459 family HAD-type hydrolase [Lutibaculum baratangense]|uniref:HAD superfamily protein involved in N-acetyl-glucosamine catabolism n=1 Tax=Lutibaculum baratangense AMV1 TaxID=631454 RepID=V4R6C9_9HYPH|nr:TIGR01459 family HAD-type hydrolase [Lutibaculum baratangense]ESR27492.1 HAD superfamily protein involved in N-acetyl-glucosamine catabolism [Lutibaculum baratangense AMV1]
MQDCTDGVLSHFREVADRYDIVLCDVWGVVHNGVAAWKEACEALQEFRTGGGRVALITNAPRPSAAVEAQLRALNVPDDVSDAIATSGDVTRDIIKAHGGKGIYHLGPKRDLGVFEGIRSEFSTLEEATLVVNTGLFDDEVETPADYEERLQALAARSVEMVCANPDIVVERGDTLLYCAGALAQRYEEIGGRVVWAGKPYPPIYEKALERLGLKAGEIDPSKVLAIGDSARTDVAGAIGLGYDALFVASGIHATETVREGIVDAEGLMRLFEGSSHPTQVMSRLRW